MDNGVSIAMTPVQLAAVMASDLHTANVGIVVKASTMKAEQSRKITVVLKKQV